MEKQVTHTRTLGGLLFGYLVRTGLCCLAICGLWFGVVLLLIQAGIVLPANSAATSALQAEDLLSEMSADHFDADALPELCRWVLLDTDASPGSTAVSRQVLDTNMTGSELSMALELGSPPVNHLYYRDVRLIDGTLCRLQYSFSVPYADPVLRRTLPDFQLCWLGVLFLLLAAVIFLMTRRTARLLKRDTALLTNACRSLVGGDLSAQELGHARIREFEQSLRTMETLRDELAASLKAQWAMEQQRSEHIAALAHDLKTPLTIIQGNAELLAEEPLTDAQRRPVDAILRGADRAGQYLAALRRTAQAVQSPALPEALDAAVLAESMGETGAALCAPRGVAFRLENRLSSPTVLYARREALSRAVENLLANAARFAPEGGHVTLCCRSEGGTVLFSVQDDGPGFPADILRGGGEWLRTGDASRSDGHQGLGLSFARTVAESHGGSLLLSNENGALALLRIPLQTDNS